MGCVNSCKRFKKSDKKSRYDFGLQFDTNYFDNTINNDDEFLNRISMITKNRNVIDEIEGRPTIIANKFKIAGEALHCGAFGCIYGVINMAETPNSEEIKHLDIQTQYKYAAKVEDLDTNGFPQLHHESRMYIALKGGEGIPNMYAYEQDSHHGILVMDMLGPSLQQVYWNCGSSLSVKTVLMCAEQMIDRVQFMHGRNFVHRDLKPDNFAIGELGTPNAAKIFVLDFGLAKRWRNYETKEKRPFMKRYRGLVGTVLFAARSAHDGWEQGRKDDLESLGYIFLYLLSMLPWMRKNLFARNPNMNTEEFFDEVHNLKRSLSMKKYGKSIPKEFILYLKYTRSLGYDTDPDYEYLRNLFRSCAKRLNIAYPYDMKFDWQS